MDFFETNFNKLMQWEKDLERLNKIQNFDVKEATKDAAERFAQFKGDMNKFKIRRQEGNQ